MFFKKKMQSRVIERLEKRFSSEFIPLRSARKIILLMESDAENIDQALDYTTSLLKERGIEWVSVVVERANKRSHDFSQKEGCVLIKQKDTTYFGLPKGLDKINEINTVYDILIDFTEEYDFTSFYISLVVEAKFKVGRYTSESTPYDFIARAEDNSAIQYVKQVVHYLESIKPAKL